MAETNWGRKETIIWPPHQPIYTIGALVLAMMATGLFVYLRFQFGLSPLQRYYLPYYCRTVTAGITHPVSKYQLVYVSDGESVGHPALDADVQPGSTPQFGGKALPLTITPNASVHGLYYLNREGPRDYNNKVLHAWIAHWIYGDVSLFDLFKMQLLFGLVAFTLQLPISINKDIRRRKEMKYGRRLKGPVLVTPKQFNKAVQGSGIGLKVDQWYASDQRTCAQ